jgi:hypothetical protein
MEVDPRRRLIRAEEIEELFTEKMAFENGVARKMKEKRLTAETELPVSVIWGLFICDTRSG